MLRLHLATVGRLTNWALLVQWQLDGKTETLPDNCPCLGDGQGTGAASLSLIAYGTNKLAILGGPLETFATFRPFIGNSHSIWHLGKTLKEAQVSACL